MICSAIAWNRSFMVLRSSPAPRPDRSDMVRIQAARSDASALHPPAAPGKQHENRGLIVQRRREVDQCFEPAAAGLVALSRVASSTDVVAWPLEMRRVRTIPQPTSAA